jgi:hypothetical protein
MRSVAEHTELTLAPGELKPAKANSFGAVVEKGGKHSYREVENNISK